jgi:archaellum component FlaC
MVHLQRPKRSHRYEDVEQTIERLFADISELKKQIREKDQRIGELEERLGVIHSLTKIEP